VESCKRVTAGVSQGQGSLEEARLEILQRREFLKATVGILQAVEISRGDGGNLAGMTGSQRH
jgi:hypothetical protein